MNRPKVNLGPPLTRIDTSGPRTWSDPAAVREHILTLHAAGMTDQAIARAAGCSIQPVGNIRKGKTQRVRQPIAEAILGVSLAAHPQQALVLNIGCRRRIEALHVMGHASSAIGKPVDVGRTMIKRWREAPRVYLETLELITAVYEDLRDIDGGDTRVKRWAARSKFHDPMAWSDIDDPDETPGTKPIEVGIDEVLLHRILNGHHHGKVDGPERTVVLDLALAEGWGHMRLADCLNVRPDSAGRALSRRRSELRKEAA